MCSIVYIYIIYRCMFMFLWLLLYCLHVLEYYLYIYCIFYIGIYLYCLAYYGILILRLC
jgi:hypothetical protein